MIASELDQQGKVGVPRAGAQIVSNSPPSGYRQQANRLVAFAANDGRSPQEASKADWEQAKRDIGSPTSAIQFEASGQNPA